MDLASQLAVVAPLGALGVGVWLLRRRRRAPGAALVALGLAAAAALFLLGERRPLVGLVAIAALGWGLGVDEPGRPGRRALALLGVTVGLFALLIAVLYT